MPGFRAKFLERSLQLLACSLEVTLDISAQFIAELGGELARRDHFVLRGIQRCVEGFPRAFVARRLEDLARPGRQRLKAIHIVWRLAIVRAAIVAHSSILCLLSPVMTELHVCSMKAVRSSRQRSFPREIS